jgi:CheY-like chemotaxis protein
MKKNILLVDDDEVFHFISKKMLARTGYAKEIYTAMNGNEALQLINIFFNEGKSLPDVIFLDLNMPLMDGFSFVKSFARLSIPDKENILIVIVSSSINPEDIHRAREMGVTHYLTKPVTEHDLRTVLETADNTIR